MQLIYEILPVFLFFIAFKLYGIYTATVVGIAATFFQVLFNRYWFGVWDRKQFITLVVFVVFGGMTLYFHNPIFVKWKPTIVFWLFAIVIFGSHFVTDRPVAQRMMEGVLQDKSNSVPSRVWHQLNAMWILFFIIMGGINLYVAYFYSNDVWVNFKFYGITAALFLFSIFQAFFLMRYLPDDK